MYTLGMPNFFTSRITTTILSIDFYQYKVNDFDTGYHIFTSIQNNLKFCTALKWLQWDPIPFLQIQSYVNMLSIQNQQYYITWGPSERVAGGPHIQGTSMASPNWSALRDRQAGTRVVPHPRATQFNLRH